MWRRRRASIRHGLPILLAGVLAAVAACGSTPPAAGSPRAAISPMSSAARSGVTTATDSATTTVPSADHVVVVVMENKDVEQVLGDGKAPFLDELARTGADFTDAHAETHPSQPNYLALFSGDTQGVTDDSCLRGLDTPNLATQLQAAGRSFVGYSESLPSPGFTGCRSGDYAQKHSPWSAFTNVPPGANQPWNAWPASFDRLPTVAFVTPDLCSDMHDCSVGVGDRWLADNLSGYLEWARSHNSLLIVTFDESESRRGDNGIVTLIDGARVRPGQVDEPVDHYRLLRTIEQMYQLPPLGRAAAVPPITDIWAS
jgi:hypothetical protein